MTYRECYEWGKKRLAEAGIGEAGLDSRLLLEAACAISFGELLAHGERLAGKDEEAKYRGWIERRASHVPLQHLTGSQEFMGLNFRVNNRVLIPRQDTEILAEEVLRQLTDGSRILDMCTGSGCILLSLLHYSNGCEGIGADISQEALKVAEDNAERLGIRARFLQSDLFEKVSGSFDLIVSNPPYIASGQIGGLMEEVRLHEPLLALDGHEDGLFFYREIVNAGSRGFLKRGGSLYLEIGYDQAEAVCGLMERAGFHGIEVKKDYAGLDRVVFGVWYPG